MANKYNLGPEWVIIPLLPNTSAQNTDDQRSVALEIKPANSVPRTRYFHIFFLKISNVDQETSLCP